MSNDASKGDNVELPRVYAAIGLALTSAQSTEALLKMVTTFVIPGQPHDWDSFQALSAAEKKKTLGYFIRLVRSRTKLFPGLEDLLNDYLQFRNDFVHNPASLSGWNLQTELGRSAAERHCLEFMHRALRLQHIFSALMEEWAEQAGIEVDMDPEVRVYFNAHVEPVRSEVQELFAHGDFSLRLNIKGAV